jgi:hypothetical protein
MANKQVGRCAQNGWHILNIICYYVLASFGAIDCHILKPTAENQREDLKADHEKIPPGRPYPNPN